MRHGNWRSKLSIASATVLLVASVVLADTLVLKNGKVVQGIFKGGTDTAVLFESNGQVQQIAVSEIASLTFSPGSSPKPQAPPPPPPQAAQAQGAITVPAGTKLMVKLEKPVNTQKDKAGALFTGLLDLDLAINGAVVAPKGSKLYGKVVVSDGGRRIGNQRIAIQYTDLVVGNQQYPIVTDVIEAEGNRGGLVKKVAAGAIIGAAVDGGKGAGTGALIGTGVGVIGGGQHIQIAAGTLAEIYLKQPVTITR